MMDLPFTLFIFLFAASTGEAIKCYECNSRNDSACANELLLEKFKTDCAEKPDGLKYTLCRKIEQIVEFEMNDLKPHIRIIRQCGWANSTHDNSKCYFRTIYGGGQQTVCSCDYQDYCNSGSLYSVTILLFVSLLSITLFI